ncbi:MAG TPA: hypothetical protein VG841_09580 [Caulobacterales bacterium]|nr:hypothetical protein [Caulobacterales bacterium]
MSLNKTLDRLFDEIRREAKRNPDFANRLDAVLRLHTSRREVDEALIEEERSAGVAPAETPRPAAAPQKAAKKPAGETPAVQKQKTPAPEINPVGLYQREGADALAAALAAKDRDALLALVAEHNLDPGGEADALDRDALATHIMAQAKRRAERDSKLFDY